jgi:hypothetical protein
MTEKLDLDQMDLTTEQAAALDYISGMAFGVVCRDFGTGYPYYQGGNNGLAFHNGYHTATVVRDARKVGASLGMSAVEVATTTGAAFAHDIVQNGPRGVMERESAEWFAEQARLKGLPDAIAQAGRYAILGTEPLFDDKGVLVGQAVSNLDFPSLSVEKIAKSVASGDLGVLYRPEGPYLGHKLYQEIKGAGPADEPDMAGLLAFERLQLALREGYHYPLKEAESVLATHKAQVMSYGAHVLKQLERGGITSWRQLEQQDLAFMRQHS